jgi:hypothetical protein
MRLRGMLQDNSTNAYTNARSKYDQASVCVKGATEPVKKYFELSKCMLTHQLKEKDVMDKVRVDMPRANNAVDQKSLHHRTSEIEFRSPGCAESQESND